MFDVFDNDGTITLQRSLIGYTIGSILNFKIYAVDTGGMENYTDVFIVIPDTSVPTVVPDNTIQYTSFFTHAPNIAWFVPVLFILIGAACIVIHTIYTTGCECPSRQSNER